MKKLFALLLAIALMLSLSITAFAEETTTITVQMTDFGWDGWESEGIYCYIVALSEPYTGASFEPDESIVLAECTFADDDQETATFTVGKMQTIYFYWVEGLYPEEAGFTIYRDGVEVYRHISEAENGGWDCDLEDGKLFFTCQHVETKSTSISYDVEPTYTVTIPASVTLGEDATIKTENVVVAKGKQVEVSIADANGFKATTPEGAELTYTVKNGETTVAEGDTVLAVNPKDGKTGETTLSFVAPETIQYAGTYTGSATFTISVKDVPMISFKFYENGTNYWSGDGEDYVVYTVLEGTTWGEWLASEDNVYNLTDGEDCIYAPGPAFLEYADKEAGNSAWPLVDDEIMADAVYVLGRY